MIPAVARALSASGDGPLTEAGIRTHIAPLFSRALASGKIYLANHSLGRPLDAMTDDIGEALTLWYDRLDDAWDSWLEERQAFRRRIAELIGAPRAGCIVPKTSAGQRLRTVLNALPGKPRVLTTRGEFDSVDVILKQYAALGKIEVRWVESGLDGDFGFKDVLAAIDRSTDLVVISQVMFMTGQIMHEMESLSEECHRHGARLLVDIYHAAGVIPVDIAGMKADFAIGGSYKYLRGGPGAGFLYLSPETLSSGFRPLDTGWFAKDDTFAYQRPDPPRLAAGGDAFLEATPPVLTWYQARSGQEFTLGIGVRRLRQWSLDQLQRCKDYLAKAGVAAVTGGDSDHGAFLTVRHSKAKELAAKLAERNIVTDVRSEWLRLGPDCLTTDEELRTAATMLGKALSA